MKYDSVYPTFRLARQARDRLGGELRRSHLSAMPDLWMRLDQRPRTSPQAGARCTPRLDRDSPRSLPRLREDLHLPPAAFSSLHPLQFADARACIAAAPGGALFLGGGNAYAQGPQPRARCFHTSSLGPRTGPLPTCFFFSPPNAHRHGSLVGAWSLGGSATWAFVLAASGSADSLAPAALRKFLHPPSLPGKAGRLRLRSHPEAKAPWARISKNSNSAFRCSIICSSRTGSRDLPVMVPSSSVSAPCTRKPALRSMSTLAKIFSIAMAAVRAAICCVLSSCLASCLSAKVSLTSNSTRLLQPILLLCSSKRAPSIISNSIATPRHGIISNSTDCMILARFKTCGSATPPAEACADISPLKAILAISCSSSVYSM